MVRSGLCEGGRELHETITQGYASGTRRTEDRHLGELAVIHAVFLR